MQNFTVFDEENDLVLAAFDENFVCEPKMDTVKNVLQFAAAYTSIELPDGNFINLILN